MTRVRVRGEGIRRFILENVEKNSTDISKKTAEKFGISRQAVNKHLQKLMSEKSLTEPDSPETALTGWHRSWRWRPVSNCRRTSRRPGLDQ